MDGDSGRLYHGIPRLLGSHRLPNVLHPQKGLSDFRLVQDIPGAPAHSVETSSAMNLRFLQKKYLLPIGILLVMALGILTPAVGLAVRRSIGTNPLVAVIFLLNVLNYNFSEIKLILLFLV